MATATAAMKCAACNDELVISEKIPFCRWCWRVPPKITREAFMRGDADVKRVAHLINERRTPARKLHQARYSTVNLKRG